MQRGLTVWNRAADDHAVAAMNAAPPPLVSDLKESAFLLDIDGTLLDFASSPRQVWVPAGMRRTLARLADATGGAVALVSGRLIGEIDLIFSPLQLPAIGVHGAEMRIAAEVGVQPRVASLSNALKRKLANIAELGPGILVEDKRYSLALHYRLAPEKGAAVLAAATKVCADMPEEKVAILSGRLVVDIKPAAIDKGNAVTELMQHAPFAGRHPIYIGDDTTDLPVFDIISRFGGRAYSVGGITADVDGRFDTPAAVRSWLARIAGETLGAAE